MAELLRLVGLGFDERQNLFDRARQRLELGLGGAGPRGCIHRHERFLPARILRH